jgi:hypothetical protein
LLVCFYCLFTSAAALKAGGPSITESTITATGSIMPKCTLTITGIGDIIPLSLFFVPFTVFYDLPTYGN